ncbi:MAG: transposase family protein [Alicyclobacillus macrosporangiidus]|uniref:transposase family protein n=1 Tax=Alicyclobacillus macrosporangiidus TaxID=392015 RepID=UPI0034E966BB|nr:transposase family protein [Alicyclobacillus macrosporangiidus]
MHSHYVRTLSDLPLCGYRAILRLNARKFRCRSTRCTQRIFALSNLHRTFPPEYETSQASAGGYFGRHRSPQRQWVELAETVCRHQQHGTHQVAAKKSRYNGENKNRK